MRRSSLLLVVLLGCGGRGPTAATVPTENEAYAISITAELSKVAEQNVKGEISDTCFNGSCATHGAAWYVGQFGKGARGTAFFYRDWVNSHEQIDIKWDASHEICHSITGFAHDERHAWCNQILFYGQNPWV